ncbi:hypothetical protein GCM10022378_03380 [Salinicoccus jeotgali]|uniref:Resolvase/invertase-type recombinase catalytic domain-containing protein n=1 Tax=Salinicoccus jeotgali TaxID=381634 RepID=A0ABP7EA37_9STAP
MTKVGYARVSTRNQNLNSQIDILKSAGYYRILSEKVGGRKTNRTELDICLDYLRTEDTLGVTGLDWLVRTTRQPAHGPDRQMPRITQEKAVMIGSLYQSKQLSIKEIMKLAGVSKGTIYNVINHHQRTV